MHVGEVVGRIWTDSHVPSLKGHRLVMVRIDGNSPIVVGVDLIGVSAGNRVLVTTDEAAQRAVGGDAPVDAAIVGLVAGMDGD